LFNAKVFSCLKAFCDTVTSQHCADVMLPSIGEVLAMIILMGTGQVFPFHFSV